MGAKFLVEKRNGAYSVMPVLQFFKDCNDGLYRVSVASARKGRSNDQNGYLWGCVYPMVLEGLIGAGWEDFTDCEQVHELCKQKFASRDIVNRNTGEVATLPSSTTEMDTVQFSAYVDSVRDWASEFLGVSIPDPNRWYHLV